MMFKFGIGKLDGNAGRQSDHVLLPGESASRAGMAERGRPGRLICGVAKWTILACAIQPQFIWANDAPLLWTEALAGSVVKPEGCSAVPVLGLDELPGLVVKNQREDDRVTPAAGHADPLPHDDHGRQRMSPAMEALLWGWTKRDAYRAQKPWDGKNLQRQMWARAGQDEINATSSTWSRRLACSSKGQTKAASSSTPTEIHSICDTNGRRFASLLVISLRTRDDRWESLDRHFRDHFGIRPERMWAFGTKQGDREAPEDKVREATESDVGKLRAYPLRSTCVFLSHAEAWRVASLRDVPTWIFEDDARLMESARKLPELLAELEAFDPAWDFIMTGRLSVAETSKWLGDEYESWPNWAKRVKNGNGSIKLIGRTDQPVTPHFVIPGASEGLWGYLVSPEGAKKLISLVAETGIAYKASLDNDMWIHSEYVRKRLRFYALKTDPDVRISGYNEHDKFSSHQNKNAARQLWERISKKLALVEDQSTSMERRRATMREVDSEIARFLLTRWGADVETFLRENQAWALDRLGRGHMAIGEKWVGSLFFAEAARIGTLEPQTLQASDLYGNLALSLLEVGAPVQACEAIQSALVLDARRQLQSGNLMRQSANVLAYLGLGQASAAATRASTFADRREPVPRNLFDQMGGVVCEQLKKKH